MNSGAEVQRPLATVVIGVLISATPLTLLVLPPVSLVLPGAPLGSDGRRWYLVRAAAGRVRLSKHPISMTHCRRKGQSIAALPSCS
jgi:hypothetical protein